MANTILKGKGTVVEADFKTVTWKGLTKGGKAATITLNNAINMGNLDFAFAEKNDTVAQVVFTACYNNTDAMSSSTEEPYTIEIEDGMGTGASEIMLGAGVVSISGTDIALSRGGSQFTVEREFREINADGDRGPVKGRIVMDGSRATLTLNTLTILSRLSDLYPGIGA